MQYTPNYHLPIYEPDDPTAWLTIFNNAMTAIDAAIAQANATDPSVLTSLQTLTTKATNAENAINTINGNLTTLNAYVPDDDKYTITNNIEGSIIYYNNIMSIGKLSFISMTYNVGDNAVPAGSVFISTNAGTKPYNMIMAYSARSRVRIYVNAENKWICEDTLAANTQYFLIGFWWN